MNTKPETNLNQQTVETIVPARDYIAQAYLGFWGTKVTQERARNRLHWMAGQVAGDTVLDIGCSEGILAILLAREGFQVTAVDVNFEAIEYAQALLEKEQLSVRQLCKFINANIYSDNLKDLGDASFDTVILGEVIEHVTQPARLLAFAMRFLKPTGRIVITTPFGYHPDPDHKQTFTLSSFVELLKEVCTPEFLDVGDGYIRFVGKKERDSATVTSDWSTINHAYLLNQAEQASIDLQKYFLEQLKDRGFLLKQAQNKSIALKEAIDVTEKVSEKNSLALEAAQKRITIVEEKLDAARNNLDSKTAENDSLSNKAGKLESQLSLAENCLVRIKSALLGENRSLASIGKVLSVSDSQKPEALQQEFEAVTRTLAAQMAARDEASHSDLWNRHLLQRVYQSPSFRIGRAVADSVVKPGMNTILAPIRIAKLIVRGSTNSFRQTRPAVASLLLTVAGSKDRLALLYTTKDISSNLTVALNKISFSLPVTGDFLLSTKESNDIKLLPKSKPFGLKPVRRYLLEGSIRGRTDLLTLTLAEYDEHQVVQEHSPLKSGDGHFVFDIRTHPAHTNACLIFRLRGTGDIVFEPLRLTEVVSNLMVTPQSISNAQALANPGSAKFENTDGHAYSKKMPGKLSLPTDHVIKHSEIKVACILDDFSLLNFSYECHLIPLSISKWRLQLEKERPDFLFVESAWAGNQNDWQYKITYSSPKQENPLFALLQYCHQQGIKTVFWNKEDPSNYGQFIDAAKRFNYIFTTDANCIERYRRDAPDATVDVLPFAAQPALQNPVNSTRINKLGEICFAGAWYPRHVERHQDARVLLEASKDFKLHIYDRYLNHPQHEKYKFPEEFQPYIHGSLSFDEMVKAYKQYPIFLNVNSVKDSPTMFSRRVFEILASGTVVVSGHAQGISDMLGDDTVPMVSNVEEARTTIEALIREPERRDRLILKGQRKIFRDHTYSHRLASILQTIGTPLAAKNEMVSVITATIRPDFLDNMMQNFKRQTWPDKELLIVINEGKALTEEMVSLAARKWNISPFRVIVAGNQDRLGHCLNLGLEAAEGNVFAKMDDDDYYGEYYLEDAIYALRYSNADCVGKSTFFTYIEAEDSVYLRSPNADYRYTNFVIGTTLVGYKSLYPMVTFGNTPVGEDTIFLKALKLHGKKLYSHSPYNYCKHYATSTDHHTWKIEKEKYLENAIHSGSGFNPAEFCF